MSALAVAKKQENRDELILSRMSQVLHLARKLSTRLPFHVSMDDLVSEGTIGLIQAVDLYDPSHGVQLKTYAEHKIRGAMLDYLRDLDWGSRHKRKKAREIATAVQVAQNKLMAFPTEDQIAAELGMPLAEYQKQRVEVAGLDLCSLDSVSPDDKRKCGDLPLLDAERVQTRALLEQAISGLPDKEKAVIKQFYLQEKQLREIAAEAGVHISRIAASKEKAILRLREVMGGKHSPGPSNHSHRRRHDSCSR